MLLQPRCVSCSANPKTCDPPCGSGQICTVVFQSCTDCGSTTCTAVAGTTTSSKTSVNAGAVAGGVFAGIIVVLAVAGYFWYRRRTMYAAAALKRATVEVKPDIVASADTVLNRPDPVEKPAVIIVSHDEATEGHPDNPFSDHASIATASDRATNVIPIGLLPPSSASIANTQVSAVPTARTPASVATTALSAIPEHPNLPLKQPGTPMRPTRDGPELDMRLDLSRPVSEAPSYLVPPKVPYAGSSKSGLSGVSSRASTISTSSSFLNEAPQIVTSKQANFRQVLGVQRAEVVQLVSNPSSPSSTQKHLSTSTSTTRKSTVPAQSPLRKTAFDAEVAQGALDSHNVQNPFADNQLRPTSARSSASASTFGFSDEHVNSQSPIHWDGSSRPGSALSTAGTIIASINSAQRGQLVKPETRGLQPSSKASSPMAPSFSSRSAGQLSPPAQAIPRSFDDDMNPRMSQSSLALSNRTSTTDSILEAFPFVPPSPMSAAHQSHPNTPLRHAFNPNIHENISQNDQAKAAPAGRSILGMSVMSTASGLGGFPFQIDSSIPLPTQATPNPPERDDRASLDTLQLSRQLAAFPLPSPSTPTTPKTSDPLQPSKQQ